MLSVIVSDVVPLHCTAKSLCKGQGRSIQFTKYEYRHAMCELVGRDREGRGEGNGLVFLSAVGI